MNPRCSSRLTFAFAFLALGSAAACSPLETQKAESALATWRNKRPTAYTYVLEPTAAHAAGRPLRVKVESEDVLEALETDGTSAMERGRSMTGLLEDALEIADEDGFSASYDDELGYVKSFYYAPESAAGGYGVDVPCLEPSLDEDACADHFRLVSTAP